MIRSVFIASVLIFSCFSWVRRAHAQQEQVHNALINRVFGFYEMKEYKASGEKYAEALISSGGKAPGKSSRYGEQNKCNQD